MKIVVCSLCYNEREMLPFYLRHYGAFADEIHVWDDMSDDGSREILSGKPSVFLHDWQFRDGIEEDQILRFCHSTYHLFAGNADWVIWPDIDEFVYQPDIRGVLSAAKQLGYKILSTTGFVMMHEGVPVDDGKSQIWKLSPNGIYSLVYSKPIVFNPNVYIQWIRGKHGVENTPTVPVDVGLKLLHYRFLGYEYTKARSARNYGRCGMKTGDKASAWCSAPTWNGDYSPEWVQKVFPTAKPVI